MRLQCRRAAPGNPYTQNARREAATHMLVGFFIHTQISASPGFPQLANQPRPAAIASQVAQTVRCARAADRALRRPARCSSKTCIEPPSAPRNPLISSSSAAVSSCCYPERNPRAHSPPASSMASKPATSFTTSARRLIMGAMVPASRLPAALTL